MKITFWGATDEVTGSMTFLDFNQTRIMVDSGLAQGTDEVEKINLLKLPFEASTIHAVFITHAHLDHSGYLPRLIKKGFRGPIYCTPATAKLMRIILTDSASLMDESFYSGKDVVTTLQQVKTVEWEEKININDSAFHFQPAGHILGASSLIIKHSNKKIVFSGDLGRHDDPLFPTPVVCPEADLIIMESTYGGKCRQGNIEKELASFLIKISREERVGIVASFAVARAQMLLTLIHDFFQRHPEEKVKVYIDSPMMKEANQVYKQYAHLTTRPHDLYNALDEIEPIDYLKQWDSIKKKKGPLIIISSSGMLTGGRIFRHLQNWQQDAGAMLFLPGYQAVGTPGRAMIEGNRTLKNRDKDSATWSGEVLTSEAFSSHADQAELIEWLTTKNQASRVFLLHGETASKLALKEKLQEKHFLVEIPERGKTLEL